MRFGGLLWTEETERHIARHAVIPSEVEEAVADTNALTLRARGPEGKRYLVLGRTQAGRYLMVVLAPMGRTIGRVVTARQMTTGEKRRYRRWSA